MTNDDYYEFLGELRNKTTQIPDDIQKKERDAEIAYKLLENSHLAQLIELKKRWFLIVAWTFLPTIIASFLWAIAVGRGWLDYSICPDFPGVFAGSFFISLVMIAHIISKHLFPSSKP